jgi:transcriptional regulator with PAS, ATPase and Fis domain
MIRLKGRVVQDQNVVLADGGFFDHRHGFLLLGGSGSFGDLRFFQLDPEKQIGRHCTNVVGNTRMHAMAETGVAEIKQVQWIKGQNMVMQRIPIRKEGRVIDVYGQVMFKDVRDVHRLARKLSVPESKVKLYEVVPLHIPPLRERPEDILPIARHLLGLLAREANAAVPDIAPEEPVTPPFPGAAGGCCR